MFGIHLFYSGFLTWNSLIEMLAMVLRSLMSCDLFTDVRMHARVFFQIDMSVCSRVTGAILVVCLIFTCRHIRILANSIPSVLSVGTLLNLASVGISTPGFIPIMVAYIGR